MGFFQNLKEDLSEAMNELIHSDADEPVETENRDVLDDNAVVSDTSFLTTNSPTEEELNNDDIAALLASLSDVSEEEEAVIIPEEESGLETTILEENVAPAPDVEENIPHDGALSEEEAMDKFRKSKSAFDAFMKSSPFAMDEEEEEDIAETKVNENVDKKTEAPGFESIAEALKHKDEPRQVSSNVEEIKAPDGPLSQDDVEALLRTLSSEEESLPKAEEALEENEEVIDEKITVSEAEPEVADVEALLATIGAESAEAENVAPTEENVLDAETEVADVEALLASIEAESVETENVAPTEENVLDAETEVADVEALLASVGVENTTLEKTEEEESLPDPDIEEAEIKESPVDDGKENDTLLKAFAEVLPDNSAEMEKQEEKQEALLGKEPPLSKEMFELPMELGIKSDETAILAKGMVIVGDVHSNGNLDIYGKAVGNVNCLGKLNLSGEIVGNIKAGEVFVDGAKVEGLVNSEGTLKVGQGSVLIGDIWASRAVIAGAIKGNIDVHGPVVLDSSAIIMGDIKSQSVQINNGAVIEGKCSQCYAAVNPSSFFEDFQKNGGNN